MAITEAVVASLNKAFGIELTEAEIGAIQNQRDLYYVLERRAMAAEAEEGCRSSHLFYQLRRALVEEFGVDRRAVTLDTPVVELLPPGRLFRVWRRLARAAGVRLPALRPRRWLENLVNVMIGLPVFVIGLFGLMEVLVAWSEGAQGGAVVLFLITAAIVALLLWLGRGLVGLTCRLDCEPLSANLTVRDLVIGALVHRGRGQDKTLWRRVSRFPISPPEKISFAREGAAQREVIRDALAAYMREDIWSFEFDEAIQNCTGNDKALLDLSLALWGLYDDLTDHPIDVSLEDWQLLRRLLAALASDLPLEVRRYHSVDVDNPPPELAYEPFWTAEQWQAHEHLLEPYNIPKYHAAVHAWRLGLPRETLTGPAKTERRSDRVAFMVEHPETVRPPSPYDASLRIPPPPTSASPPPAETAANRGRLPRSPGT